MRRKPRKYRLKRCLISYNTPYACTNVHKFKKNAYCIGSVRLRSLANTTHTERETHTFAQTPFSSSLIFRFNRIRALFTLLLFLYLAKSVCIRFCCQFPLSRIHISGTCAAWMLYKPSRKKICNLNVRILALANRYKMQEKPPKLHVGWLNVIWIWLEPYGLL